MENRQLSTTSNWSLLAWSLTFTGLVLGCFGLILVLLGIKASWVSPMVAFAGLGWLHVAAWAPQALLWTHEKRKARAQAQRLSAEHSDTASEQGASRKKRKPARPSQWRARKWVHITVVILASVGAIATWYLGWPQDAGSEYLIWFILVGLLAFPSLVLSNALSASSDARCNARTQFTKFSTFSLLLIGLASALRGSALSVDFVAGDAPLSIWALRLLGLVHITLASEYLARAAISPFLPNFSIDRLNSSVLLNLLIGRQYSASANGGFEDQFGIDLSQSWAAQFIRYYSPSIAMVLIVATWATTSVTTLRVDERGLYQRMGSVAPHMMEPGLHVHLPWPFGSVRRISYGAISEVRLNDEEKRRSTEKTGIEAETGTQDDRIWSKGHGGELFLMIANQPRLNTQDNGTRDSQRSYELYHADVVVTYRVGLQPQQSRDATYGVSHHGELVARIGRRELIELFNSRTAEDLLFADFSQFAKISHKALQDRLDALGTGIDIVNVIFEAVHPPVNTAETFHRVHGAEKESAVIVDIARAEAEKLQATAQINAIQIKDEAKADAFSNTARARAEDVVFSMEKRALDSAPEVFEFERSLQVIERTFTGKNLIIVDPKVNADQGMVLDLRENAAHAPQITGQDEQ